MRMLEAVTGMGPGEYLRGRRLSEAARRPPARLA
jgi:hypothetical protein